MKVKIRKTASTRTVAYIRCSSEEQVDSGLGLEAQKARITAYCVATDRTLDEVYEDAGFSGKSLERPAMERLLSAMRSGDVGSIVMLRLDRLSRSLGDICALIKECNEREVGLVSVAESFDTKSPAGRCFMQVLGSFAGV